MKRIIRVCEGKADVVADALELLRGDALTLADVAAGRILPLPLWRAWREQAGSGVVIAGVWIAADDEFDDVAEALVTLPLLAVDFPTFRDGRGYSVAYLLRSRHGYTGELRAVGDVLRDQLFYMHRCGFDSFEVRADKDIHDALLGLTTYTVRYQGAVDDPVPLFRKRVADPSGSADHPWEP
ncbi:hypothetical protein JHS3_17320 [Jeongeupia sp. HS-3]|uniref:DUF934 domain-containing protein n=1 Tax=Jeongeupia sp. HS-3 TaxID=1009682 RepID=UPI0018A37237|nr:DUF934 domain-containing protein [Jeongeupia sp. HS-3]BCL75996.1 hypothetical protein JHS3_17320 [Jeongeupia sp. HS-3]